MSPGLAFPRGARLTAKRSFDRVFRENQRSSDPMFTVLAAPNALNRARLGQAVSRKTDRHASGRNRIKRIVRESFRHAAHSLPAADFVVIARSPAAAASNDELRDSLSRHWRRLTRRCAG